MSRINGIGTTLLGVSKMNQNNVASATKWFTFLFLPIIPLARYYVQFIDPDNYEYSFFILSKEKLKLDEILKTYLFGWIIIPSLIFGTLLGKIHLIIFLIDNSLINENLDFLSVVLIIILLGGWSVSLIYLWEKWKKNRYYPKH